MFGGGGPVGRGWQAGLLTGLLERGVDVSGADLIVGTSAGAILGALLAAGVHLAPVDERALRMGQMVPGLTASRDASVRAGLGAAALAAETMSEVESLSRATFAPLAGMGWPSNFAATAVNARSGEFRVFRAGDGVPLPSAAASSALPGVYPPITVGGEQYVDGGLRSMLNVDLAAGFDVVAVVSCFPLDAGDEVDISALRNNEAGSVITVVPEERLRGMNMLDQKLVGRAYEVGRDQASVEAVDFAEAWSARPPHPAS